MSKAIFESGADGVMIGRGSYGKPWIFEIIKNSTGIKDFKISRKFKKEIILEHFDNSINHYGEEIGVKSFRKHIGWYSKSLENSNEFRYKINSCNQKKNIEDLIKEFF